MKIKYIAILISLIIVAGCKKNSSTYQPISENEIASALGMEKLQVRLPVNNSIEGTWSKLGFVLVEGEKETPVGPIVGLGNNIPEVIDIIIWPSDDPEMYYVMAGGCKSGIRHSLFTSQNIPTRTFFSGEVLEHDDFLFKGSNDGSMTSTQQLQPNEFGVKVRLIK